MSQKPNIIFILNDHQAYYNHDLVHRPNYEKFASEGVKFTRAYTCCPLCGPARRSMLTGLFPHNHREIKNNSNYPWDRETYLDLLAAGGYKNYYYGKWHAGKGTALNHHCEGFNYGSYNNPYTKPEYKNYLERYNLPHFQVKIHEVYWKPKGIAARYYGIKVGKLFSPKRFWCNEHAIGTMTTPKETHEAFFVANLACEKLREIAKEGNSQPFHLRADFWGPHQPYYATQEFLDMYDPDKIPEHPSFRDNLKNKPETYKREANYPMSKKRSLIIPNPMPWTKWQQLLHFVYAQQTLVDAAGGLILDTVKELGLADNTIIIWSCDHGDAVACHGGHFDKAWYMPEEMMRVPMAVKFPGKIAERQVNNALVSNMDIPVTILDAAGISFNEPVDGESILPISMDKNAEWRENLMCETHGHPSSLLGRVLITDKYKYIWNHGDMDELYDLKEDPNELNNLINNEDHKETIDDMKNRLKKWRDKTGDIVTRDKIGLFRLKGKKGKDIYKYPVMKKI